VSTYICVEEGSLRMGRGRGCVGVGGWIGGRGSAGAFCGWRRCLIHTPLSQVLLEWSTEERTEEPRRGKEIGE
jgi:hypothetical protein